MKQFNKLYVLLPFLFLLTISCTDDTENDPLESKAIGTITLSGPETAELGNSLKVGNIAISNTALTGTDKSVVLLSDTISVEDNELVFDNIDNGFIIVASDFSTGGSTTAQSAISMTIIRDKIEYLHACTSPNTGIFITCGDDFSVDFNNQKVVFNNTTVINTSTSEVLTLNGTVTWN